MLCYASHTVAHDPDYTTVAEGECLVEAWSGATHHWYRFEDVVKCEKVFGSHISVEYYDGLYTHQTLDGSIRQIIYKPKRDDHTQ